MVPPTIQDNLAGLRLRERLLAFAWGVACWLAIAIVLLLVCGFIDWFIDRRRDTPFSVRIGLFAIQMFVGVAAAFCFLVLPQLRRLTDEMLALWVEDKLHHFDHRLISAVQFNQAGAKLDGMSVELVKIVTKEAENQAAQVGFAQVADHSRLKWCASLLGPVLLIAAAPFLIKPETTLALLQRQALLDVEIPHSITMFSTSPKVWPIGETIPIRFRVKGAVTDNLVGELLVGSRSQGTTSPRRRSSILPGDASDEYELKFIQWDGADAIYGADVEPATADIRYSARMLDGRTKLPSEMKLVPRPVVIDNQAWVRLPAYCGLRPLLEGEKATPEERRYQVPQGRGDVTGIPGSGVRVQLTAQKPIKQAWLQFLGVEKIRVPKIVKEQLPDDTVVPNIVEEEAFTPEKPIGEPKEMKVSPDGSSAELSFDLTDGMTGYRMRVIDEHDFENVPQPRRSLRVVAEELPQVMLLRDTFGIGADFDVEGLPVPLGERIRIPYACFHPYGLGKANLLYRMVKKHESGENPAEEEPWVRLPLPEVNPDFKAGAFDSKTGMFVNTEPVEGSVPFHAVPSSKPQTELGRKLGGGRYLLETNGLINSKGMKVQLKSGDMIEYCVEVFAAHREPEASIPVARSETRVSTVMSLAEFLAWRDAVTKEDEGVRRLEKKQKGVFDR